MLVRRGMILFAVMATALAFAGCGGGGGDSTVSKQEFAKELEQVCKNGREARRLLLKELAKEYYEERAHAPTDAYQAGNILKLVDVIKETTAEIAEIGLPEGKEKQVEDWIRVREEAAAKVEASPLGTRDNLQAIFEGSYEASRSLGAGSCDL
jgi:hypothetical protein